MTSVRAVAIASVAVVLGAHPVVAQDLSRYRGYSLASSVASVIKISGTREDATKTLHERPARIQEVQWRAPYVLSNSEGADPVRDVRFSFYDDRLYQIVVSYDRDRMEGLTNDDVIESISATYGVPLLRHGRTALNALAAEAPSETMVVAQWEDDASLLTLTRGTYSPQYQFVLISKTLNQQARSAVGEALRRDTQEAPQRELDQRRQALADARIAGDKARGVNKAAFKP